MAIRSSSPAVARALLVSELKMARAARGETQEEVARACEMSIAKFSRIENLVSVPSKGDIVLLFRHYGIDDFRIEEMTELARVARSHGWWQRYDFGPDRGFEAYVGYEDGASSIRMSQPLVIPGLLQTPDYTREIMRAWGSSEEAIARAVSLREDRQDRVAARAPEQVYVVAEEILRRSAGNSLAGQLSRLLRVAEKPAVTIRVVPMRSGAHFGLRGPFVILGFPGELDNVLYLESARRGDLIIAERKDQLGGPNNPRFENLAEVVAEYENGFETLCHIALSAHESLEALKSITASL